MPRRARRVALDERLDGVPMIESRFRCPSCGFPILDRRRPTCDSCGRALPAELLLTETQRLVLDADAEKLRKERLSIARKEAREKEKRLRKWRE